SRSGRTASDRIGASFQLFTDLADLWRGSDDVWLPQAFGIRAVASSGADRFHYPQSVSLRCLRTSAGLPHLEFYCFGSSLDGNLLHLPSRLAQVDSAWAEQATPGSFRMIPVALLLAFFFWAGSPIAHSKYERPVQVSIAGQNYVAVDETIWAHARGDLGDVRLFAADTEIPYSV